MKRRQFILSAAGFAAAAANANASADGPAPAGGGADERFLDAVAPPGAGSVGRLLAKCSACGLCIASCPRKALRAAGPFAYGPAGMMMPRMDYGRGFCDRHCRKCSEVCPAGALKPMGAEEKERLRIGVVEYRPDFCVVNCDRVNCGLCAANCPHGAIELVKEEGAKFAHPKVRPELCTGCGRCEQYCPGRPKALKVRGLRVHESVAARPAAEAAPEGAAAEKVSG